ncbi:o-succinylbenzoate synthase [Actinomyces vulturis]|uniref:o-succinylbenzoate synthase n=1 Tax=Actinomyces vulturis TaxID=1857645 RepID=UPI000A8A6629|nr:o-succinylbenzoate synthase [Actinomyces vulturis]
MDLSLAEILPHDRTGLLEGVERIVVFDVPTTTRFRGLTRRDGLLIQGPRGWAEAAPFWNYSADQSAPWLACALEWAGAGPWHSWQPPALVRRRVDVNVTIPAISAERAHAMTAISGARTAKVKISDHPGSFADDALRLEAVRDALGPNGKIRIDVNGAWDVDEAVRNLPLLDNAAGGLEYCEQPCATVEELAQVRRQCDVPIAADESIRLSNQPQDVVRLEAADVAIIKVAPLGGITRATQIAETLGLPTIVSSALETSVGMATGLHLAGSLPNLAGACGLGTVKLLGRDVSVRPLIPVLHEMDVRPASISAPLLKSASANEDVSQRWQTRLIHMLGALSQRLR